jgi:predicted O-methyltransferase YrrM
METLSELIENWKDTSESHQRIHDLFCQKTNQNPKLKRLRDYVEANAFGFGERSFYWMWKLITDDLKNNLKFLEVGVFRGQTTCLISLLKPNAKVTGITPLDSTDGHWESDYKKDIEHLHELFLTEQPNIIKGLSTDQEIIKQAKGKYDIVYIDGGHQYEVVKSDLINYPSMVKKGGYLIIDDCANKYQIPFGMFGGIETVSRAVDEWKNQEFKELFSVVHIRAFKKL